MTERRVLLGNAAIARGLIEAGCHFATAYAGTPSSEILPSFVGFVKEENTGAYAEWSTNEKVAYDNALAASYTGKRAAVIMKQVGLNVAADSLMSSAYTGTVGGLVVISCDDPGPHSSQTEQDSRYFAMFAKVPAFDPVSPDDARKLLKRAYEISEELQIPVIFRAAIRICHARQTIDFDEPLKLDRPAVFEKAPGRWAATPKFRLILHRQLNEKIEKARQLFEEFPENAATFEPEKAKLGIIAAGIPYANVIDILEETGLTKEIPVLRIATPYPLPEKMVEKFIAGCNKVLLLEEPDETIELQIRDKSKIWGRLTGHAPRAGELLPEVIWDVISRALKEAGVNEGLTPIDDSVRGETQKLGLPVRRPSLCPGCPHRAAFYAIRKALPKGIYTSDIGCYTLGLNLGVVDTCLDMGAAITIASGFCNAFKLDGKDQPVAATIGDSTFYHSGPAGLISAVYNDARFVLVILDNATTAMTGMQPTPGTGIRADGSQVPQLPLERLVEGCGVDFIRVHDPYDVKGMIELVKEAHEHTRQPDGKVAVIIARHPCLVNIRGIPPEEQVEVEVTEECNGCKVCIERFECPSLVFDEEKEKVRIDYLNCARCGVCVDVCARKAIVVKEK
jgi:indolepyruvate ferredoxin oxidoreductase alpha subunit